MKSLIPQREMREVITGGFGKKYDFFPREKNADFIPVIFCPLAA
jgi:hypothetical protein